jgi:Raf kinase inhibitor-like YbhB/YbcL family protein
MAFTLTTPAFRDGDLVPTEFTGDAGDAAPDLSVSDVPEGTRSFALVMDDPDAPKGTFTHWLVYDIPTDGSDLAVTQGKTLRNGFGRYQRAE